MYKRIQHLLILMTPLALTGAVQAQNAEQVLQKARETYLAMTTYSDKGTIVKEYGSEGRPSADRFSFATHFRRSPRAFVLEFQKPGGDAFVIWGDPDAFHTWWKTTGAVYDFQNPNNIAAISGSAPTTIGVGMKIPTLLYGKSQLAGLLLAFADPSMDGTEAVSGHQCYRVAGRASDTYAATGNEVNVRQITVWIDRESYLVRQVREHWKPAVVGQVNRVTTTYDPQSNPRLEEAQLRFKAPEAK